MLSSRTNYILFSHNCVENIESKNRNKVSTIHTIKMYIYIYISKPNIL